MNEMTVRVMDRFYENNRRSVWVLAIVLAITFITYVGCYLNFRSNHLLQCESDSEQCAFETVYLERGQGHAFRIFTPLMMLDAQFTGASFVEARN